MGKFLLHWFTVAVALGVASWLLPGVEVTSLPALLVAALVLGFINALVRPVIFLLTLPFTIVTFGLFIFAVNGIAFALAAGLVPGFHVSGCFSAMMGAVVVGLVSWLVGFALGGKKEKAAEG